jgi:hypothetical protein
VQSWKQGLNNACDVGIGLWGLTSMAALIAQPSMGSVSIDEKY